MPCVIYRKSDRVVAGYFHGRRRSGLETDALAAELASIVNSELGGTVDDYDVVSVPAILRDQTAVVAADLTVSWEEPPRRAAKRSAQQSARGKLRALGLTDEEIDVLAGAP